MSYFNSIFKSNLNLSMILKSLLMVLRSKNKLRFISKTLLRPQDFDFLSIAWDRARGNTMIMVWMTNTIDIIIAHSVIRMDTNKNKLVKLKDQYYQCDIFYNLIQRGDLRSSLR